MSRKTVQRGSQRATKSRRREKRHYRNLSSLVQPRGAAEAEWLRKQGQGGLAAASWAR